MAVKRKIKRSAKSEVVLLFDAFDDYIMEKEALNKSEATIKSYSETFRKFYVFLGMDEESPVDEITQKDIYKWIGVMKQDGISISSINHYLREIRAFLYWCMDKDRGYIDNFEVNLLSHQEEPPKCFSDDELKLLMEKPRPRDSFSEWRTWAIVSWVLGTGNRAATICSIRMRDVNFKRKEINLPHTKNKKAQILPLSSSLSTVLKEYIRIWRKDADDDEYLFCNIAEDRLTTNALRQSFEKYCKDRGVEHTSIHGLRHSFAKGWVRNNGNMFALQKILGHATLEMTRRYVKLFGEELKEDFEKFNPLDVMKKNVKRTQTVSRSRY